MAEDYYQKLGIERTAGKDEIKAAYRRLAKKYHPDVSGCENDSEFMEIREAYEVLIDPKKRKAYDATLGRKVKVRIEPLKQKRKMGTEPLVFKQGYRYHAYPLYCDIEEILENFERLHSLILRKIFGF